MSEKAEQSATERCSCCTCGYTWPTGQHGGHSCADQLLARVAELEASNLALGDRNAAVEDELARNLDYRAAYREATSELAALKQPSAGVPVYQFQCREIGEGGFEPCDYERYLYCQKSPEHDTRVVEQSRAQLAAPAGVPDVLFDGYAVLMALSEKAMARTSAENVSDVLDAIVELLRAAPSPAPAYRSYTTTPGEAVAGIALRQLKDESRWVEIRDLNAHAFPDIGPNDYYPVGTVLRLPAPASARPDLTVWCGPMPESNGKSNFTAILMRKGAGLFDGISSGITIARSEYPDRVRYEADRMRYLIGELESEPDILAYDPDKHSGYKAPASDVVPVPRELPPFAQKVIAKLKRFEECADDGQGADIGRHWFDLLTQLGLLNRVQRSPGLWEISQQGEDLLNGGRDE